MIDGTAKWLVGRATFGPFDHRRQSKTNNCCHHAAQVDFSLFVLELPLPIEKRKCYSFRNFRFQIQNRKLEFYYSLCNFRSQIEKPKSTFSLFDLELRKAKTVCVPLCVLELHSQIEKEEVVVLLFVLERDWGVWWVEHINLPSMHAWGARHTLDTSILVYLPFLYCNYYYSTKLLIVSSFLLKWPCRSLS